MLIKIILIVAALGLLVILLQRRDAAKTRAWKKLIMIALVAFAVFSILNPDFTSTIAHFVGVGRGTDLLLYALVAVFVYVVVGFYLNFRDVQRQLTILARRLAIDEAMQRHHGTAAEPPPPSPRS
jgi:hypothetical protein